MLKIFVTVLNWFRPIHLHSHDSFVAYLRSSGCREVTATLFIARGATQGGVAFSATMRNGRHIIWKDVSWTGDSSELEGLMKVATLGTIRMRAVRQLTAIRKELGANGSFVTKFVEFNGNVRSFPANAHSKGV